MKRHDAKRADTEKTAYGSEGSGFEFLRAC